VDEIWTIYDLWITDGIADGIGWSELSMRYVFELVFGMCVDWMGSNWSDVILCMLSRACI
jgi:hypothetical protein